MFQSISRGWGFLKQAISMAAKDRDLIKPSIFSFFANAIVGVVFAIPLVAAAILLGGGDNLVGRAVLFVLGAIMLFAQYTVSYVFSGMTVYLIYGYLSEGDGRMDKAWEIVKRDLLDIMSLAAASAVVKIVENTLRGRNGRRNLIGGLVANILNTVWTTATYFVLPAMIIEDLNLPNALKRATHMIKNNLLLVAVSYVGVNTITGAIGFLLVAGTIIFGVAVTAGLGSLLDTAGLIVGIILAVAAFVLVVAVVTVFTSYIGTAYHTCLFIWAREAEKAQATGQPAQAAQAPAPLAAVLGS
jgi:membrane-anchored glycerophosphoryl diester phosphodiesterase (GDPDase)